MFAVPYDSTYSPPAPVITVMATNPIIGGLTAPARPIIDSGAEQTVLPEDLILQLKVPPNRPVPVSGFGGTGISLLEYFVELTLPGMAPVLAAVLAGPKDLDPVLGRDVLNRYRVVLDGPNQTLEIG